MGTTIAFHGAARTVTGSRHLLTLNGKHILVDCGVFQGSRELKERNWLDFPIPPSDIDAIILTHAHNDHIGYLPRLVKLGYQGPVFATHGTHGISKISLPDSGRIQEEDAEYHNRKGTSRHTPAEPLFTEADAYASLKLFKTVHFHEFIPLPGGAQFRFIPAGHILGSAFAEIYFENGERILMSGDLGRYDHPILKDPTPCDFAEYLTIESTYGNRVHQNEDVQAVLKDVLDHAIARRSCIVVPSFAIGRTQDLLWHLNELEQRGELPELPIYVDSPMANAATLLYNTPSDDMDADLKVDLTEGNSPFRQDFVRFIRDRNQSKSLNSNDGPMMIISGSGMLTGGRVIHHLKRRLGNPDDIILFTGFQAQGTMGRLLLEGADEVTLHRERIPVAARIEKLNSLSAHADSNEIMRWLGNFKSAPKKTFIVHGEPEAQDALKTRIETELGWSVAIPELGQLFSLD